MEGDRSLPICRLFGMNESGVDSKLVSGERCRTGESRRLVSIAREAKARVRSAVSRREKDIAGSRTRSAAGIPLAGISWSSILEGLALDSGIARVRRAGKNFGRGGTSNRRLRENQCR